MWARKFRDGIARRLLRFLRLACNFLKYSGRASAIFFPPFRPSLTAAGSLLLCQNSEDVASTPDRIMHDLGPTTKEHWTRQVFFNKPILDYACIPLTCYNGAKFTSLRVPF